MYTYMHMKKHHIDLFEHFYINNNNDFYCKYFNCHKVEKADSID